MYELVRHQHLFFCLDRIIAFSILDQDQLDQAFLSILSCFLEAPSIQD